MFCSNCGKEIDSNSKYCKNCGTEVHDSKTANGQTKKNEVSDSSFSDCNLDIPHVKPKEIATIIALPAANKHKEVDVDNWFKSVIREDPTEEAPNKSVEAPVKMGKFDNFFKNMYKYNVDWPVWRKFLYLIYYIGLCTFTLVLIGGFIVFLFLSFVGSFLPGIGLIPNTNCLSITKKNVSVTVTKNYDAVYTLTADFVNAVPKTINFPKGGHVHLVDSEKNTDGIMLTTDENGDKWMIIMPESSCTN
ncbi:MAG: zinc ribbon domain-containing protein [bacterium]